MGNGVETRSNGSNLDKFRLQKEMGRKWFTNRAVDKRDRLSNHLVHAIMIETFNERLDIL